MIQINGADVSVVTDGLEHAEVLPYGHPSEVIESDLGPGVDEWVGLPASRTAYVVDI